MVTERQWHSEDTDDTATQQLPRVQPPLPGSLDPVRRMSAPEPTQDTNAATGSDSGHDSTAVLSIDDLMGPPQQAPAAPPVQAVAPPPPPVPAVPVAQPSTPGSAHPASQAAPPAATTPPVATASTSAGRAPAPAGPSVVDRVRGDAAVAWSAGMRRTQTWLSAGDNAVIVATALVALLLLIMVAAL